MTGRPAILSVLLAAGFLAMAALAAETTPFDAEKTQTDAYLAVIQADQARDRGDAAGAAQWYRTAASTYETLARNSPDWHPEIVQYRLTYCANEINALQSKLVHGRQPTNAAPEQAAATTNAASSASDALAGENEKLRQEMAQLNAELQARPASEKWEADVRQSHDEIAALQAQLAAMSNRVAVAVPPKRQELNAVKDENDRLSYELDMAKKRGDALLETVDTQAASLKECEQLQVQLRELNDKYQALNKQLGKAKDDLAAALQEKRVKKLEDLVAQLRADLKAAQDQADKLKKQVASLEEEKAQAKNK